MLHGQAFAQFLYEPGTRIEQEGSTPAKCRV